MEFQFNKQKSCPECGCTVVIKEEVQADGHTFGYRSFPPRVHEHCNGGRWETRTFLCGYACQYVPNFLRNESVAPCRETDEFKAAEKRREEIRNQISALQAQLRDT